MKLVQHPNVVRLYEVIDTPNKLYLILEFGDGGDMYDYIMRHANGLNESTARRYFRQICRALKYCHEMHVCHRDLKVRKKKTRRRRCFEIVNRKKNATTISVHIMKVLFLLLEKKGMKGHIARVSSKKSISL